MTTTQTKSGFVSQIADSLKRGEKRRNAVAKVVETCQTLGPDSFPPENFVNVIGSDTYKHFKATMISTFQEFTTRFDLNSNSVVLDIGCGCGRLALPFSFFLRDGAYFGVDVWEEGLDWCKSNISDRNRNFQFIRIEAENNYYFDDFNSEVKNSFSLQEIENRSIDFAYALSVFTHLTADDCRAYLHELARTLKKDGSAYLTAFIIDDFFFKFKSRTGQHRAVKETAPGCYHAYHGQDFFAGFTRKFWTEMCTEAGLRIVSYELGKWAEKPGARTYQDIFVVVPVGTPSPGKESNA